MRIFISHSSVQAREAAALRQWLIDSVGTSAEDIFLDIDTKHGLHPGEKWKKGLLQAITRSEVMLCLLSVEWESSVECQAEFRVAEGMNREIVPVRLKDKTGSRTSDYQWVDLFGEVGPAQVDLTEVEFEFNHRRDVLSFPSAGLRRLQELLADRGIGAHTFEWPPSGKKRDPYPGGLPLDEEDAGVYFGRDAQLVRALDTLRAMPEAGKTILQIIGHSGAGKSSFLRAGLISRLRRDVSNYVVLDIVRPESDVIDGPAGFVSSILTAVSRWDDTASSARVDVGRTCRTGDAAEVWQLLVGVQDRAADGRAEQPTLVLPIDQAEELVTVEALNGKAAAKRFLDLLGAHANAPDRPRLLVVMTVRTDHLEALEAAMAVAGLDAESTEVFADLGPMPEAQFANIIEGPARRTTTKSGGRLVIDPVLTEQLIEDCQGTSGSLPLLALTLARLYTLYGEDGDLRHDEYDDMGGMTKVVEAEVNEVLSPHRVTREKELELLKPAFVGKLATLNLDTDQFVRRIASWGEFSPAVVPLLKKFVDKRLLVAGEGGTVEVAMEGFFELWSELSGWLAEGREDLREAVVLQRELKEWRNHNRSNDYLIHGQRLAAAERLMQSEPEVAFTSASSRKLAFAFLKKSRRRERQSTVLRVASVAAVILTVLAVVVGLMWRESDRLSRALELVSEADGMLQGVRPGGDIQALQRLVAAQKLGAPTAEAVANLRRDLVKIFENPPTKTAQDEQSVTPVNGIAISPDRKFIASANGDNRVRVWDTESGAQLYEPLDIEGDSAVSSVTFVGPKNGAPRFLAAAGRDGGLSFWNPRSGGSPVFTIPAADTGGIRDLASSDNGNLIAIAGDGGVVRVWNTGDGTKVMDVEHDPFKHAVRSVAFQPKIIDELKNGRPTTTLVPGPEHVVTGGDDGVVRLWDVESGAQVEASGDPSRSATATSVAFDYAGDCLAVGRRDGNVEILDGNTLQIVTHPVKVHPGVVNSVAYSPGGKRIVSGGDSDVSVWEAEDNLDVPGCQTNELTQIGEPLSGHHGVVAAVEFDNLGSRIVSGGADGSVRIWDAQAGLPIPADQGGALRSVAITVDGERLRVDQGDGILIASGGVDGSVKLWNSTTGAQGELGHRGEGQEITALGFSPDGTRLVSGSKDGILRVWDRTKLPKPPEAPNVSIDDPAAHEVSIGSWIKSLAISDSFIATADAAGFIRLWTLDRLRPVAERPAGVDESTQTGESAPQYQVWSVAFDSSGRRLVSGSGFEVGTALGTTPRENNILQLWEVDPSASDDGALTATPPVMVRQPGQNLYSVAFSPDDSMIASGGNDGTVRFWDPTNGRELRPPMGADQNAVMSVAFSSDGTSIAAGGADGKVRVWDVGTGRLRDALDGHHNWVHGVAYVGNGGNGLLVSGSADGTLRLWPASNPDLVKQLCPKISNAELPSRPWNDPLLWLRGEVDYCPT